MDKLKNNTSTAEYTEGINYTVDLEYSEIHTIFYFRSTDGGLIGYAKIYESDDPKYCRGTIIDAISSYKLDKNLSQSMQELFKEKGYNGTEFRDFGSTIYSYVLKYLQKKYGDKILINVASNDNDSAKIRIMNCLSKTKERTEGIIKDFRGGDGESGDAAVIYLQDIK